MLYSVIRTPRLCDQFHKAMKQRQLSLKDKKLAAKMDVDTHLYLRLEIEKHKNETKFINKFMTQVDRVHLADIVQPDHLSKPRSDDDYNCNSDDELPPQKIESKKLVKSRNILRR